MLLFIHRKGETTTKGRNAMNPDMQIIHRAIAKFFQTGVSVRKVTPTENGKSYAVGLAGLPGKRVKKTAHVVISENSETVFVSWENVGIRLDVSSL
jgi:hypothetical protein